MPEANGGNVCSISVCSDVNSVINQPFNSCSYGNVNTTAELHVKSAELCELTLHTFSAVAYPGVFFGGGSTNSVEDRGQRGRGSGGSSPLIRGSGGSCNLVQEI